jgi:hypothetical protein
MQSVKGPYPEANKVIVEAIVKAQNWVENVEYIDTAGGNKRRYADRCTTRAEIIGKAYEIIVINRHQKQSLNYWGERMNKFWMVLRERGQSSPTMRHQDKSSAIEEATLLCKKEKENYYVLEAVGIVAQVEAPVVYTDIFRAGGGGGVDCCSRGGILWPS